MYLTDSDIKKLIDNNTILNAVKYDSVSVELHIDHIIVAEENTKLCELAPGETVLVACNEQINMPKDMVGIVIQKNSRLRCGLTVNAPVYRPGHNTKIFVSVTNISANIIEIVSGEAIAALMLDKLDSEPTQTYDGTFQNEESYKGLGNYKGIWDAKVKKVEDKYDSVMNLEKSIYATVITLMTIFIGIFSLINFEISFIKDGVGSFSDMLLYNLIHITGLSFLFSLINCILPNSKLKSKVFTFIIPVACFIATVILI